MTRKEHLFLKLTEECAEVQRRVSKLLQFGPDAGRLRYEIDDMLTVIEMLEENGWLPQVTYDDLVRHRTDKKVKIAKYLKLSESLGNVDTRDD